MNEKPLRWGFIGAGHIAQKALGPACRAANNSILQAVAASDLARAELLAPVGRIYSDYHQILEDDTVDAIYICLTNDAHVPLSIAALQAGKHVLSEKPLGMNANEVQALLKAAKLSDQLMVEASWNRWHPRTKRVIELVKNGVIGAVTDISAGFVYQGTQPDNYRLQPKRGGGALYDLGPYPIAALLWLTDFADPTDLQVQVDWGATGVDMDVKLVCNLGSIRACADVSMKRANDQWLHVTGELGSIKMLGDQAFTSWQEPSELQVQVNGDTRTEGFASVNAYQVMVESFADRARGGTSWVMPLEESLAFSRFFDRIFDSAR